MWLLSQLNLIAFVSYIYISLYVWLQNPGHRLNRSCATFLICLALWSLEKMYYCAPGMTPELVWIWNHIGSLGWIGLSPAFLWFALTLTGRVDEPKHRRMLWIILALGIAILMAQFKGLLIREFLLMPYGWTWRWSNNIWMWLFFSYYSVVMLYSVTIILIYSGQPPAIPIKMHAYHLGAFSLISLAFASSTDTLAPFLGIYSIPPLGNVGCLLWALWLGYAVARHRFLAITPKSAAENIIRTMSDLLVLTDTQWRIVRINRAVEECLGLAQKRLEGRHIAELLMPDEWEKGIQTQIKQGSVQIENLRLELKNSSGQAISAIFSSSQLIDEDQPAGIVVLIKDISHIKHTETALKQSEERYRELVESINEVIFSLNADGFITYLSPAFENLTGYKIKETLGKDILDIIYSEDVDNFREQKSRLFLGNTNLTRYRLTRKKEGGCWVQVSSRPLIVDGQVVGANGILTDISGLIKAQEEKKNLETRLARAEKMEAIGTLAGAVAHDLNNVLSGIVSYPDLMLLELPENSHLHKFVKTMKSSGEKAAAIVQDLLTLARRGVINTELVDLNQIIEAYLASPEFLTLKSKFPNIQINSDLAEDLACISGSPVHLSKAIMNLMANAFEAISDGKGEIFLKTENSTMTASPADAQDAVKRIKSVIFRIRDTGIGITEEDQKRIFEPFFTRKIMGHSGTGLGMSVVWGAVQDHHGQIDIDSQLGRGTEFILYFPMSEDRQKPRRPVAPVHAPLLRGSGESVLVVDDMQDQIEIATAILSQMGYKVYSVSSGEQALEFLKHHFIDLVILDMVMAPGMDGLDTFSEIQKIRPHQKVIIASGYSENERISLALKKGVVTCLKKPYLMEEIGSKVQSTLRNLS